MPATLPIPHECLEHVDILDKLLDVVHDLGGALVKWGACLKPTTIERVWVSVEGLPGRTDPLTRTGSTVNTAARAILHFEWPDPSDAAEDPA